MGNIKGNLPLIKDLIYNIPVTVLDYSGDRWTKDKCRKITKKGVTYYEFAKRGNTLPLFKRSKGRMFVFTTDGVNYQPMYMDLTKASFYLPEYEMDEWRDSQMRRIEDKVRAKKNAKEEAIKFIGIGICALLILIGVTYFAMETASTVQSCNCAINGIDLNYCMDLITNQTASGGSGVI